MGHAFRQRLRGADLIFGKGRGLENFSEAQFPDSSYPLHANVFDRDVFFLSFTNVHKDRSIELSFNKVTSIIQHQMDGLTELPTNSGMWHKNSLPGTLILEPIFLDGIASKETCSWESPWITCMATFWVVFDASRPLSLTFRL